MEEATGNGAVATLTKLEGQTREEQELTLKPKNHYTLRSRIGYSDNVRAFIVNGKSDQLIVGQDTTQESKEGVLTIKVQRADRYGVGVYALKLLYLYTNFIFTGFLATFAFYLMLQYAIGVFLHGILLQGDEPSVLAALSVLCLPVMIDSLSFFLTVAVGVLRDGYNNLEYLQNAVSFKSEPWITPAIFVLGPVTCMAIALIAGSEEPVFYGLACALFLSGTLYAVYVVAVFYLEVTASFQLWAIAPPHSSTRLRSSNGVIRMFELLLTRVKQYWVITRPSSQLPYSLPRGLALFYEDVSEDYQKWSLKAYRISPFYGKGSDPNTLFVCCSSRHDLESMELEPRVKFKALLLVATGFTVSCGLFAGYLLWSNVLDGVDVIASVTVVTISFLFIALIWFQCARGIILSGCKSEDPAHVRAHRKAHSRTVVAEPTTKVAALMIIAAVIFLFVIPVSAMSGLSVPMTLCYAVLSALYFFRTIFDVSEALRYVGPEAFERLEATYSSPESQYQSTRRIILLLTNMLPSKSARVWNGFLLTAISLFLFLAVLSSGIVESGATFKATTLLGSADNLTFFYPSLDPDLSGFQYPACDIQVTKTENRQLQNVSYPNVLDFSFMAGLAYVKSEFIQESLDRWYGDGKAKLLNTSCKTTTNTVVRPFFVEESLGEPVLVLSVKGTSTSVDALVDAQLWTGAVSLQLLRALVPFGSIWNDILPTMAYALNSIQTDNTESYLEDVSQFTKCALEENNQTTHRAITGHSLGGGLAMLVGARLKLPTFSFSGPNAKISGLSYGIAQQDYDKFVVNVIPNKDVIPMVDEPPLVTENIRCIAPTSAGVVTCHSIARTACELMNICGSLNRPPFANCKEFGYDPPLPIVQAQ